MSSGFPYFLQFKPEFCNKESMIWTTVSSGLIFANCIVFLHLPMQKIYNQSDFGYDHLVMSMHRVISWVVGRGCLLWPVYSLGKNLLAFAMLHFVLQGQTCLLFQVSLDFLLLHSSLLWKKYIFLVFGGVPWWEQGSDQSSEFLMWRGRRLWSTSHHLGAAGLARPGQ